MDIKFIVITLGTWFLFIILAIANAGLREKVFTEFFDELRSHQLSTFTRMIFLFVVTYLVLRYSGIDLTDTQAFIMGTIWFIMAISFEFLAGHYVFGNSWELLIGDYNIFKGRIWVLILITTFLAPYLAKKLV